MAGGGNGKVQQEEPEEFWLEKCSEFTDDFHRELQRMRQQNQLIDYHLKIGENEIPCHKLVLATSSEYFRAIFYHLSMARVASQSANLDSLDFNALITVINYFYNGEIYFDFKAVKDVLKVLQYLKYNKPFLMTRISAYIVKNLNTKNCLEWYLLAHQYSLIDVRNKASEIMVVNFTEITESSEFLDLDFEALISYIRRAIMENSSLRDKSLEAAARWCQHNASTRLQKFEDITQIIDLERCSPNMLKLVFEKYERSLINTVDLLKQFTKVALSSTTEEQEQPRQQGRSRAIPKQLRNTAHNEPRHARHEEKGHRTRKHPNHAEQEQLKQQQSEEGEHPTKLHKTAQELPKLEQPSQQQKRPRAREHPKHPEQEQLKQQHSEEEHPTKLCKTAQELPKLEQPSQQQKRPRAREHPKHPEQEQLEQQLNEEEHPTKLHKTAHEPAKIEQPSQQQKKPRAREHPKHPEQEQLKQQQSEEEEYPTKLHKTAQESPRIEQPSPQQNSGSDIAQHQPTTQQHSIPGTIQEQPMHCQSPSDSSVLVIGGYADPNKYNRRTWVLNLQTQTATEKSPIPVDLCGMVICAVPQGAICLGGTPTKLIKDATDQCHLYDKYKDEWIELPRFPDPITSARAVCVKDRFVYAIGAQEPRSKSAICFDLLETKMWTRCPDMKQGMVWPLLGCIKDSIYAIFSTILANTTKHRTTNQDAMVQDQFSNSNNQGETELTVQCFNTSTQSWGFCCQFTREHH